MGIRSGRIQPTGSRLPNFVQQRPLPLGTAHVKAVWDSA
jgi:hypothetical protein